MDYIRAGNNCIGPNDRIQDRPAEDGDDPFRQADQKRPTRPEGIWEGMVRPALFRFAVYSLLMTGIVVLSVNPRYDSPLFLAICCWGGAIIVGIIGWLTTFDRFKLIPPIQGDSAVGDNPFKKRESRWSVVLIGGIAAVIWGLVLLGTIFRLFFS